MISKTNVNWLSFSTSSCSYNQSNAFASRVLTVSAFFKLSPVGHSCLSVHPFGLLSIRCRRPGCGIRFLCSRIPHLEPSCIPLRCSSWKFNGPRTKRRSPADTLHRCISVLFRPFVKCSESTSVLTIPRQRHLSKSDPYILSFNTTRRRVRVRSGFITHTLCFNAVSQRPI